MTRCSSILAAACAAAAASALDNGLGLTPQMGYNSVRLSPPALRRARARRALTAVRAAFRRARAPRTQWYDLGMQPSEAMVRATVDAMVSGGFVAAGYRYLNLDDGIVQPARDANGDLVADAAGFPNGFKAVADYVHANGMLFGVYTDRGTNTCGGRAGALGHEVADANFYARNGFE